MTDAESPQPAANAAIDPVTGVAHVASQTPAPEIEVSDPATVVAQVRRCLEDLLAFEGRQFVAPAAAASGVPAAAPAAATVGDAGAELEAFRQRICACTRCDLGHTRTNFVFGAGNPQAGILFVGEAPGQEEDRRGLPFVGPAGELLTRIITAMGLQRQEVFICNVLKCRPPGNRDPRPEEVAACEPYLQGQIEIICPRVICCLGRHAAHALLKTDAPLSQLRDQVHDYGGTPLIVTYHPAALLRTPRYKRAAWEDVKMVRRQYDGTEL